MIKARTILAKKERLTSASSIDLSAYKRYDRHVLVLCHANYCNSLGGTEKVVYEQSLALEARGIGVLSFFPKPRSVFSWRKKQEYGCVVDGILVNDLFKGEQLPALCNQFQFDQFFIHHLKDWQVGDRENLLSFINLKPFFFVHDFYAFCPSINFSCLNVACRGGRCSRMYTEKLVKRWRARFYGILSQSRQVIAPSHFVKETLEKFFPDYVREVCVQAPVLLVPLTAKSRESTPKIRLAFLGYESPIKGYNLWQSLVEDNRLQSLYEFIQIGGDSKGSPRSKSVPFNHYIEGRERAVELLLEHDVDLVFLWSMVPETFSFTLHEALAAGRAVITSPLSGNIAATVERLKSGVVVPDEISLRKLLLNLDAVKALIKKNPPRSLASNAWFLDEDSSVET